ncbi:MAG: apolipoprotein N-acyltransferase [Lentisphaeria bacterium]|nr:apolipoprotein N-acyltransferase [Lentisphaeria bacterium]
MMEKIRMFRLSGWGIAAEYVLLAVCGALFTLAFPGIDWNMLAWIGAIPVCLAVLTSNPGAAFLKAFTWSWFWNFTAFFWLREIVVPLPIGMAFTLAPFTAVWACIAAWLRKNLEFSVQDRLDGATQCAKVKPFSKPLTGILFLLGSSGLWCVLEWIRSWIFTGLPWNLLAAAQWRNIPLIQICEYTGIYGVSFCIIMMNMALAMTIPQLPVIIKGKRFWPLVTAMVILAFSLFFGFRLLKRAEKVETVPFRAGVVQCDLTQRRNPVAGQGEEALDVCLELSRQILQKEHETIAVSLDTPAKRQVPLSVIIWPETAVPVPYRGVSELSGEYRFRLGKLITKYQVPFLIGSLDYELSTTSPDGYDLMNSALLIREPGGTVADKFSKIHLVPFGEYVPYGKEFPAFAKLVGMGRDLAPGKRFNPIELSPDVKAGISICFESAFPYVSRGHVLNGANLLVIISNDAWYPTSNEPEQHFANALFRAVENRLPILRSGNSSHTLWISPSGTVQKTALSGLHDRGRTAAVFTVQVPKNHQLTFYSRFGNIVIVLFGFLGFLAAVPAFMNWNMYRLAQGNRT